MIVLPCNQTAFFDCDDTLVLWSPTQEQKDKHGIEIECPGGFTIIDGELVRSPLRKEKLVPHLTHIEQLRKHKARNHTVIVWPAGGWQWAESVVIVPGIEQFVDLIVSKPTWSYDDKRPEQFMPPSQWMEDE